MKNKEIKANTLEDDCVLGEDCNNIVSARIPYSTKQFKNWVYSNKGKVYSHHLQYFWVDKENDNCESIYSSFDEKDFMYLSSKEVIRLNIILIKSK